MPGVDGPSKTEQVVSGAFQHVPFEGTLGASVIRRKQGPFTVTGGLPREAQRRN